MVGLGKARETVEKAADKITASAELTARAIGAAIGIAIVALLTALAALVLAVRGRAAARV